MTKSSFALLLFFLLAITLLSLSGCELLDPDEEPEKTDTTSGVWYSLGFQDKQVSRLRLFKPYLYACAGADGLWRLNIEVEGSDWEQLGVTDTSQQDNPDLGAVDVLVDTTNPNVMLVSTYFKDANGHNVFKSLDGGNTWFVSDSGMSHDGTPRTVLFLHTPYSIFVARQIWGTCRSSNWGATWEETPGGYDVPELDDFRHHPSDPAILWMGGGSYFDTPVLVISQDSGATWEHVNLEETASVFQGRVFSIAFDPIDLETVYLSVYGGIIRTTNGGVSWSDFPAPISGFIHEGSQPGHLYIAGAPEAGKPSIVKTDDGGTTWIDLECPFEGTLSAMLFDPDKEVLYFGTRLGYMSSSLGVYVYKPNFNRVLNQ